MPAINRRQAMVPARRGGASESERHRARAVVGTRRLRDRAAAGAAARADADVRDGDRGAAGAAAGGVPLFRARRPRSPDRPSRTPSDGAAVLRTVADARRCPSTRRRWRRSARSISISRRGRRPRGRAGARSTRRWASCAAALGTDVYSTEGRGMEQVVGQLLRDARLTVAVAESCTGGLLASRLTDVPGSSAYVDRGIVALQQPGEDGSSGRAAALIAAHGAVSEPVALAMADGIRRRARRRRRRRHHRDRGTGRRHAEKPVGTVAIAVEGPWGEPRPDAYVSRAAATGEVLRDAGRDGRSAPLRWLRRRRAVRCGSSLRSISSPRACARDVQQTRSRCVSGWNAKHATRVGWVSPERMHLTLAFLGEVSEAGAARWSRPARDAARRLRRSSFVSAGLGMFPPPADRTSIWLGVNEGRNRCGSCIGKCSHDSTVCHLRVTAAPFRRT